MPQLFSHRKALIELAVIFLAALAMFVLAWLVGSNDPLPRAVVPLGDLRNPLIYAVTVLMFGLGIFGLRRWLETTRAEYEFQRLFENVPVGVFRSTPDGRFLMANPASAQMLGYSSTEELLAAFNDITHQLYVYPQRRVAYLEELQHKGTVRDFENQVYRKDGSVIWILGSGRAERDTNGSILYIEGILQDITARKESEEAYRRLVEQSLQGIVILQNLRIVFCNRTFADLLGYSVSEMLELTRAQTVLLIHPDDRGQVRERIQERLAGENVPSHFVFQMLHRDGRTRWVETDSSLIEHQGAPAILLLMVDITERKLAHDKMQENMQRTQLRGDLNAALARAGNDLPQVLATFARLVAMSIGQSCTVMLLNADSTMLEPVAYHHANARVVEMVRDALMGKQIPLRGNGYDTALETGRPFLLEHIDAAELTRLTGDLFTPAVKHFDTFSALLAPLRAQAKTLGVAVVARHVAENAFDAQDIQLVQELADRSGLAIANAQLVEQLQSELEARRQAENKYRALVEQIPAITYIASVARIGQTLYVSPQIQTTLGYSVEEWLADDSMWVKALYPDDRGWVLQKDAHTRHMQLPFHGEYRLVARDGSIHWVRDDAMFVYDDQNQPLFQQGVMIDITAHKALEAKYARALEHAQAEQRAAPGLMAMANAMHLAPAMHDEPSASEERAFAQALSQAAALLNLAVDTEQVLDGILDTVANIVPYETASVFLREGPNLVMARARGFEKYELAEWVQHVTFSSALPKFQKLVAHGKPVVIADTQLDADWVFLAETAWIRSQVTAPIRIGMETIGMLGLDSATPHFYHAEHGTRLIAFADLAAAALRSAQLLVETRQRAEQLSLLYDVGLTLNRVLEARTQLEFLFKIAQRALHSDNMGFFRYVPDNDALVFEMGVGLTPEMKQELADQTLSVQTGEGAVGWIAKHRLPALIPEVSQDPRWLAAEYQFETAVGVPVEHENELHGVLLAVRTRPEPFTAQDERMLILFANQVAAAIELTRLFQSQTQRTHELEILRQASLAFAAADHAALPALILEFALRLVSANNAFFFFYRNDELEYGDMRWSKNTTMQPQAFVPRRDGLTHTVARTGEIIVIDRVNTDPLFANWQWGGAIVGLPLKGGGEVRAVLNVAYEEPHRFTHEELRALELLADQAAVALENARHRQETEAQLRDARLLHRAGEQLNQSLSSAETIERLADFFLEAFQVQVCTISAIDAAHDEIRILLDRDPQPETREALGTRHHLAEFPYILKLLQERQTLVFRRDDPTLDPGTAKNMDALQWLAMMVVPFHAGQETIGVVELASQHAPVTFTPRDIRLAESLAHQAASALQNARLFQETQRRAEELTMLNRLARRVNRAATLDEMLETIDNEIAQVLPSDASYFALYDAATERVDFCRVVDFGELRPSFQFELGPSFTRQVITSARALRLDDRRNYPSVENPPQFYGDGRALSSFLAAPIRSGDRVLGVISLQARQRAAFSAADEQLLQTIADQVAAPIERIQRGS